MNIIRNKIDALPMGLTELKGPIGQRMGCFLDHRVRSDHAWDVVFREAEDAFRNKVDDQSGVVGLWQGEFWGKLIIGAVQVCEYDRDETLKGRIRESVHRLLALQEENGYLGTYRQPGWVLAADPEKSQGVMGWPCDWNWNIWCRKYTLWGLLEAHRILNDEKMLSAAARLGEHLINQLKNQGLKLRETGTFLGMPSCSILKPLLLLYRQTGDSKVLCFCEEIARDWEDPSGAMPNLLTNAFSGAPIHEWAAESWKWAKVYEFLSCLEGLLDLYRVTGRAEILHAVEKLYVTVVAHEANHLGSIGYNDIFARASAQPNSISEPCDAIHFMRLSYELFALTGRCEYIDHFENTFYNAFLASVHRGGKWGARGVRSAGRHLAVRQQAGMRHNHCCVNNMPRAFMNAVETAVMAGAGELWVNLYSELKTIAPIDGNQVQLEIDGGYLTKGSVTITVTAKEPLNLWLRIPRWSASTKIDCGAISFNGSPGTYFQVAVEAGQSEIKIRFDRSPRMARQAGIPPVRDEKSWAVTRWVCAGEQESAVPVERMATAHLITMRVGPLLLARSKSLGATEAEMFAGPFLEGDPGECRLSPREETDCLCSFDATIGSKGHVINARVCDFASVGNQWLENDCHFSIFF